MVYKKSMKDVYENACDVSEHFHSTYSIYVMCYRVTFHDLIIVIGSWQDPNIWCIKEFKSFDYNLKYKTMH